MTTFVNTKINQMTEKQKVGRPKKRPTKVLAFRVPAQYAEKLKLLIQQLIDKEKV